MHPWKGIVVLLKNLRSTNEWPQTAVVKNQRTLACSFTIQHPSLGQPLGPSGVPVMTCDQISSLHRVDKKQACSALCFP